MAAAWCRTPAHVAIRYCAGISNRQAQKNESLVFNRLRQTALHWSRSISAPSMAAPSVYMPLCAPYASVPGQHKLWRHPCTGSQFGRHMSLYFSSALVSIMALHGQYALFLRSTKLPRWQGEWRAGYGTTSSGARKGLQTRHISSSSRHALAYSAIMRFFCS